jgi:hypothetical protein
MSTTRPYPPGDRPESGGAAEAPAGGASVPSVGDDAEPAAGRNTRRLSFAGESGVVPLARDFARQALYAWGWLPAEGAERRAAAEDVLLVVSELVTNACLHAGGPEELRLHRGAKALRMEVVDGGAGDPAPRTPHRSGRPGGHGMFIVQRLCLDWGVVRSTDQPGKTVWAEMAAPS